AQLPPLVRAERQLARAERIRSDPRQKAAELLSVAKTAATEIPNISGKADLSSEQPIQIYNRAAADLAAELPELNNGRNGFESLTTQNRITGEIYQLQLSSPERGEYPSTYFQEFLDAQKLKPRRGEPAVVRSGL